MFNVPGGDWQPGLRSVSTLGFVKIWFLVFDLRAYFIKSKADAGSLADRRNASACWLTVHACLK